jgi:hypothetical protein
MDANNLNIESTELILKMIQFYDKWKNSQFRVSTDTYDKRIIGGDISKLLYELIDKKDYSEFDIKTFNSLLQIYTIHQ